MPRKVKRNDSWLIRIYRITPIMRWVVENYDTIKWVIKLIEQLLKLT